MPLQKGQQNCKANHWQRPFNQHLAWSSIECIYITYICVFLEYVSSIVGKFANTKQVDVSDDQSFVLRLKDQPPTGCHPRHATRRWRLNRLAMLEAPNSGGILEVRSVHGLQNRYHTYCIYFAGDSLCFSIALCLCWFALISPGHMLLEGLSHWEAPSIVRTMSAPLSPEISRDFVIFILISSCADCSDSLLAG